MTYTTVALVSAYLDITINDSSTPSSDTVETYIDWAADEINRFTKSQFESVIHVGEIIDYNSDTANTSANVSDSTGAYQLPYQLDLVQVSDTPIIRIDKVWFNSAPAYDTPDWVEKTVGLGGQVIADGNSIKLIDPGDVPRLGSASIKINYVAGKTTVPKFVEKLATRMVAYEIMTGKQSQTLTQGTGRIRIGDIELDDPSTFSTAYVKQTADEIDKYLAQLGSQQYYTI